MSALAITASNFIPSSQAKFERSQIAGEALTAGQPVRKNASGVWVKAQANAADTFLAGGLAAQSVGAGAPFDVLTKDPNLAIGATVVKGTGYAVGATAAGTIEPLADLGTGEFMHFLGLGKSTSTINFNAGIQMTSGNTAL